MEEEKKHGLTGIRNAAKPAEKKSESYIHARCKTSDKAGWVRAAKVKNMKLTAWIVETLNKEK